MDEPIPYGNRGERGYTLDDVLCWTTAPPEKLSLMVSDGLFLLMEWMGEDDGPLDLPEVPPPPPRQPDEKMKGYLERANNGLPELKWRERWKL